MSNYVVSDSNLSSVADAIRTKGGTSAQLAFPAGFVSAINDISGGGGAMLENFDGTMSIMPRTGTVSGDITINQPGCSLGLGRAFQEVAKATGVGPFKLKIICKNIVSPSQGAGRLTYFCYGTKAFSEVEFVLSDQIWAGSDIGMFAQGSSDNSLQSVTGLEFSLDNYTGSTLSYTMFRYATGLREIRFRENSSTQLINFATNASFSDATLVSLANALKVSTGSASLTLHATPKGKLSSIMGTVSSVTRGQETYDKFTADANGTVTLQDFITTTKGWTLA